MSRASRALAGGSALGVAAGWNAASIGAVAPQLGHAYRVGLPTIGLLTTAFFLSHLALQVPGGHASDRLGARRVGMLGLLVIAAANAIPLVDRSVALAFLGRALTGVGTGMGFVAGSDYIRAAGGTAFGQGVFGGVGVGAGGLALGIVPAVESAATWRAPWATSIAVAAVALAVVAAGPADVRVEHARGRARGIARDTALWRLAAVHAGSFGLSLVVSNWVVTLLEKHGYSKGSAAAIGALTLLLGIVSRPLGGWIARTHPQRLNSVLVASMAAGAGGTALLAATRPPALAAFAAVVVGFAAGIPFAAVFSGAARTHPEAPGAAVAVVNATGNLAVVAGTPLVGLAFSLPGAGRVGFLAVAGAWAAATVVIPRR